MHLVNTSLLFKIYYLVCKTGFIITYLALNYKLERFLRKNILAVYFLQNLAIHFNNYCKSKTNFVYLSLNHPSVKTLIRFDYTC